MPPSELDTLYELPGGRIMLHRLSFRFSGLRFLAIASFVMISLVGAVNPAAASPSSGGAVYTLTNSASGNAVQEFERAADGSLVAGASFDTGGLGSGTGLGSQGAIVLSQNNRWLFAVNAGSNEISAFAVQPGNLVLVDKVSSKGTNPISVTYNDGLLYVLNAGDGGNIAGFKVKKDGHLNYIHNSSRFLSNKGVGASPSPEEIAFTPDGKFLVVSEKGSGLIDQYQVEDGVAHGPQTNVSSGPAPYGFGFTDRNVLVISEAANSAVSTYKVTKKGLNVISASLIDTQAAACWLVVTPNSKYAYAANAASGTISGYQIAKNGELTLLRPDGINGMIGAGTHPIDMSFDRDGNFLYVLASGNSTVNAFRINQDGSLTFISSFSSPSGASGLAAW
jgi:6-phosphogluconolactonase